MTQIADTHAPTEAESQLIAAYWDEVSPCMIKSIEDASEQEPAARPILMQARSQNEATTTLLVRRQISWGDAAERLNQTDDAAREKLRALNSTPTRPSEAQQDAAPRRVEVNYCDQRVSPQCR